MKEKSGILALVAKARERAQGDSLGVMGDWRLQAAAVDAARARLARKSTPKQEQIYIGALRAMIPVLGIKDAASFRAKHREFATQIAGRDSDVAQALQDPPPLRADPDALKSLAEKFGREGWSVQLVLGELAIEGKSQIAKGYSERRRQEPQEAVGGHP